MFGEKEKIAVYLGGDHAAFEAKGKLLNGIENEYNANISATEEILEKTFDPFWNYEHSLDEKIKNAVKIDTRILK